MVILLRCSWIFLVQSWNKLFLVFRYIDIYVTVIASRGLNKVFGGILEHVKSKMLMHEVKVSC